MLAEERYRSRPGILRCNLIVDLRPFVIEKTVGDSRIGVKFVSFPEVVELAIKFSDQGRRNKGIFFCIQPKDGTLQCR